METLISRSVEQCDTVVKDPCQLGSEKLCHSGKGFMHKKNYGFKWFYFRLQMAMSTKTVPQTRAMALPQTGT